MWQSCFSLLQWPAGTELRQTISSCQRTSVGIQKQMWIASSFSINIHKPSRNKLSQLFFKDSAKYWLWNKNEICRSWTSLFWNTCFAMESKWQKNGTLQCGQLTCMWSVALDECKTRFRSFLEENTATKGSKKRYCHPMLWVHHLSSP